jgi:type IV pilus assembly protein PilB
MLKAGFAATDLDGSWRPYRAVGCSACSNGYKGRVGIYQVMPVTEEIQTIILNEGTSMDIAKQAQRENVRDLRQSGLIKVRAGVTTLEEVISVTNE